MDAEPGFWSMECGIEEWKMESGIWDTEHGPLTMEHGIWNTDYRIWSVTFA